MSEQIPQDIAPGGGGSVPVTSAPVTRKRRTSLASRGEPMVWLCGGCAAVAVLMIGLLLAFVAYNGFTTFWPNPVERVAYADGRVILGEPTRGETFYYDEDVNQNGVLDEYEDIDRDGQIDKRLPIDRTLYRTGNYTAGSDPFVWVRHDRVADVTRPADVLTIEWEEKSVIFGTLAAVEREGDDGTERLEGEAARGKLDDWHAEARRRLAEAREVDAGPLAEVNEQRAKLDRGLAKVAYEHGDDAPQVEAARAAQADERAALDDEAAELTREIRRLEGEAEAYKVELRTAEGELIPQEIGTDELVHLASVVRLYRANDLSVGDKLGIYLDRWGEYLTSDPRQANSEGGVLPAILGTVMLTLLMVVLVVPLGVTAAIYLREYAKQGPLTSLVRISVNNLAGVPSIVYGVFGYGFFCLLVGGYIDGGPANVSVDPLGEGAWWWLLTAAVVVLGGAVGLGYLSGRVGKSDKVATGGFATRAVGMGLFGMWALSLVLIGAVLLKTPYFDGLYPYLASRGSPVLGKGSVMWASLTLALLTLPVVIVATEEALSAVPKSMREGAYACGASKWQTIRKIVLPRALPGIMTGTILAIARGAGEVAPIMIVGALMTGGSRPFDFGDNPVTGLDGWFGLNESFQHLGLTIFGLGFQATDSEASRPLLFTTVLLLIAIVVTLNMTAIYLRGRLRKAYAGGAF